ncbi:MAG: hypothetical protein Kow0059_11250 [Candidatus Sumerlaeia bacterium]
MFSTETKPFDRLPRGGLWVWFAATVVLRLGLIVLTCLGAGLTLRQFALLHDGWEYMRLALALAHGGWGVSAPAPEHLRLYPGLPMAMAAVSLGRWPEAAGLAISILSAAAAGVLTATLGGGDRRLAALMVGLTPSWLVFTSTVMSEGLEMALILWALLAIRHEKWLTAGLAAGLAYLVRPAGVFLILPLVVETAVRKAGRRGAAGVGLALGFPLLHAAASQALWGDALRAAREYAAKDFDWPLRTLVIQLADPGRDGLRWALVVSSIAVSLAGGWGLWRAWRSGSAGHRALLLWHTAAGSFYLLLPSSWTFGCMDRFLLAVWPTTLIGLVPLIERLGRWFWPLAAAATAGSVWVGWLWLVHLARVFPFDARALP